MLVNASKRLAAGGLSLVLFACGGAGPAGSSDFDPDLSTLELPMDAYQSTPRDDVLITQASTLIVADCMGKQGFAWATPPSPPEGVPRAPINDRRYGIRKASDARQFGFAPAPDPVSEKLAAFQAQVGEEMSGAEEQALFGAGDDEGCFAVSDHALNGGESVDSTFSQDLAAEAYATASASGAVSDAADRWAACMSERGYPGLGAVSEFEGDDKWSTTVKPTPEEIQAAVADVACKEASDYVETFYEAELQEQLALIEENSEAFDDYRHKLDRLLERAADIIEKG